MQFGFGGFLPVAPARGCNRTGIAFESGFTGLQMAGLHIAKTQVHVIQTLQSGCLQFVILGWRDLRVRKRHPNRANSGKWRCAVLLAEEWA